MAHVRPPPRLIEPILGDRAATLMRMRSEEHTSELQSRQYLVCRLVLEKTNTSIRPAGVKLGAKVVMSNSEFNQHVQDHTHAAKPGDRQENPELECVGQTYPNPGDEQHT